MKPNHELHRIKNELHNKLIYQSRRQLEPTLRHELDSRVWVSVNINIGAYKAWMMDKIKSQRK
jgi:hypothetical protein